MPQTQAEFRLPPRTEESEQDQEIRLHSVLLRLIEEAADEVGRKGICYALSITEQLLGKQLREVEEKRPSYKLLAYLVKHQKSGRLARWLLADYAGFLPPQRPDLVEPVDALREVVAMALSGDFGNAGRDRVLALYERTRAVKP